VLSLTFSLAYRNKGWLLHKNSVQILVMIVDCCACVEICNHPPSSNRINMIPLQSRRTDALCCTALQHLGLYVWRIGRPPTCTRTAPEKLPWTAAGLQRNDTTWFITCSWKSFKKHFMYSSWRFLSESWIHSQTAYGHNLHMCGLLADQNLWTYRKYLKLNQKPVSWAP